MSDALAAIHPSLESLKQAYQNLGMDVDNVALKNLMMQDTIIQANPNLITAIQGLTTEMVALDNMGLLNVDTFGAMMRSGYDMYVQLQAGAQAAGGSARDALLPMQGWLQEAFTQAQLLGIPLDANTQEMINQSQALGIWKEAGKSANDMLLAGMTSLVDKVAQLIDKLNGVTSSVNAIPRNVDINVQGRYIPPDIPDMPDWGGAMAEGGDFMVNRPTMFLAGEAGPERAWFSGGGKQGEQPGGGSGSAADMSAVEGKLANIEDALRDQSRQMVIAFQDALATR